MVDNRLSTATLCRYISAFMTRLGLPTVHAF